MLLAEFYTYPPIHLNSLFSCNTMPSEDRHRKPKHSVQGFAQCLLCSSSFELTGPKV